MEILYAIGIGFIASWLSNIEHDEVGTFRDSIVVFPTATLAYLAMYLGA